MAKTWNAPVLEELSIPAGTFGSVDDAAAASPDYNNGGTDAGTTAS